VLGGGIFVEQNSDQMVTYLKKRPHYAVVELTEGRSGLRLLANNEERSRLGAAAGE
jgi:hypothetical protein